MIDMAEEMKIQRIVLEFENRIVIYDGKLATKFWGLIEGFVAKLDLDRTNYGGPIITPLPSYIFDARDRKDFPR